MFIFKTTKSRMKWVELMECMGEVRNAYKIRRPRHRWEDIINTDLKEVGQEGVN
jgi:hypothetical protein